LIVGAIASSLLLGVIFYTKDFDLGTISEQHKRTADALWNVREQYLSLLTDIAAGVVPAEGIVKRRDALQQSLDTIYSSARVTSAEAYAAAQSALKCKEDLTFSDAEIDLLLPSGIRKENATESKNTAATGPRISTP
jgi:SMODS and SLOG-associating 2TM effector domain family 4